MGRPAEKLEQLKAAKSEGAVRKSANAMRSLVSQPTSNQTALLDPSRFLDVYGGAGGACSACHPAPTAEALTRQSHVRAKESVKKSALELMQDHRRNIASARDSYSKDGRGNDLDPVTRQARVEKAVAAARAIEALGRLDEQLAKDEADLRILGAKARRAGGDFDPDWIGDFRQLISHASNEAVEKAFAEFEVDVRRPDVSPLAKNGALQVAVTRLEKWRIKQREELALNLGVLYEEFPFFGTHILPSLLVRVADMPRGTVVPPENQIAMGFATLLANIDDVIERIASDKIDPLSLPRAVALAQGRMLLSEWVALQELLDEKKRQEEIEFLLSLTLPFVLAMLPLLGAVAVGASGASAAAAAEVAAAIELGGNTAAAVAGGIMFLGEAEEASNRFALEAASGSHDRSLLGVPALSGGDAMMIAIDGILTAAGLFGVARGIQGHGESRAGSGNPPPVGSSKDVNQGTTSQVPSKGKSIDELQYQLGMAKLPVSHASPKAPAGGKSIDELSYQLGMAQPPVSDAPPKAPSAGGVKASVPGSGEVADPAAIDWLARNKQSQPPREQPRLHLPAEQTTSLNPLPTESRVAAPRAPKHASTGTSASVPVSKPAAEPKVAETTRKPKVTEKPRAPADEFADFQKMLAEEFGATGPISSDKLLQLYRHGSRATVVKYLKQNLMKQAAAEGVMTVGDISVAVKPGVALDKQVDAFVKSLEGAHSTPQAFGKKLPKDVQKALSSGEYNPDDALVALTAKPTHTAMDQPWKDAFNNIRKAGAKQATAQSVFDDVADGIRKTPGMSDSEKATRIGRLSDEMFTELGLVPDREYPIPRIFNWWEILALKAKGN